MDSHRVVNENDRRARCRRARARRPRSGAARPGTARRNVKDQDTGKPVMRVYREGWQSVIADLKTGRARQCSPRISTGRAGIRGTSRICSTHARQTGRLGASLSGSLKLTNGGEDGEQFMARVMVAQANKSRADDDERRVRRCHGTGYTGRSYSGGRRPTAISTRRGDREIPPSATHGRRRGGTDLAGVRRADPRPGTFPAPPS